MSSGHRSKKRHFGPNAPGNQTTSLKNSPFTQQNLLDVGMRIRKAVSGGYRTGSIMPKSDFSDTTPIVIYEDKSGDVSMHDGYRVCAPSSPAAASSGVRKKRTMDDVAAEDGANKTMFEYREEASMGSKKALFGQKGQSRIHYVARNGSPVKRRSFTPSKSSRDVIMQEDFEEPDFLLPQS